MKPLTLSDKEIQALLQGSPISDIPPWGAGGDEQIEEYLVQICREVSVDMGTQLRAEPPHYGCGYASFVDVWFYKKTTEFAFPKIWAGRPTTGMDDVYFGLTVYLSRLSPYIVFCEHWKNIQSGSGTTGGGLEVVDSFSTPAVARLALQAQPLLEARGLVRLKKNDLASLLPSTVEMTSNLGDAPYTTFDALFYWND